MSQFFVMPLQHVKSTSYNLGREACHCEELAGQIKVTVDFQGSNFAKILFFA